MDFLIVTDEAPLPAKQPHVQALIPKAEYSVVHSLGKSEWELQQWLSVSCGCRASAPNLQVAVLFLMVIWVTWMADEPTAGYLVVLLECHCGVSWGLSWCDLIKDSTMTSGISVRAAFRIKCSNEGFVVERSTRAFSSYTGNTKQFSTLSFFFTCLVSVGFLPLLQFNCLFLCSYCFNVCSQKSSSSRITVDVTVQLNAGCKAFCKSTLKQSSAASK